MLTLFRLLPLAWRLPLYYRCFSNSVESHNELYEEAPLAVAPSVRMSLLPGDCAHRPIAYTGVYEWPVTKRISELARGGGLLIDVGANAGYYTLLWCALKQENQVHAFEALPSNVIRLQHNVDANNMGARVTIHPFALGSENGTVPFETAGPTQSGWGGLSISDSATSIQVQVQRLDDVISILSGPTTIKVDCEGADPWVLEGAQALLERPQVQHVFFEVNEERQSGLGIRPDASQKILKAFGFTCEQIGPSDWQASRV